MPREKKWREHQTWKTDKEGTRLHFGGNLPGAEEEEARAGKNSNTAWATPERYVSAMWTTHERHVNTAWAPRRKLKWLHLSVRGQKQSCSAKNRRSRWQLRLIMAGKRCWHYSEHIKRLISLANRILSYDYVGFWLQYKRAIEHVSNKSKCIPTSLFSARRCSFQCS